VVNNPREVWVYVSARPTQSPLVRRPDVMKLATDHIARGTRNARSARLAATTLALGALGAAAAIGAAGAGALTIDSASVPHFAGALVNQSSRSLYILSSERGAALKCAGSCLSTWVPLEVSTATKSVSLGAGVKGKIGFVARGSAKKQVTFNSYPLYSFAGDGGAGASKGEDVKALGGTWTLVHADASTVGATPFAKSTPKPPVATTTTTTKPAPPTTTTTTPGGGGGVGY
jgi:predicted lipoprotein with Yx(FWY)xxD motif